MENDEIKVPYIRADTYIQEAFELKEWSIEDRDILIKFGLPSETIDQLGIKTEAFQEALLLWKRLQNTNSEAAKNWQQLHEECINIKKEMLHLFRFAFHNNKPLLSLTEKIAKRRNNPALMQDLANMHIMATENMNLLIPVGFTHEKLNRLGKLSDIAPDALAMSNCERRDHSEKDLKDRFYTVLKKDIDEIRRFGKFVFANNPERLKGYKSACIKDRNLRNRNSQKEESLNDHR